jgi:hypothetical protein
MDVDVALDPGLVLTVRVSRLHRRDDGALVLFDA